MKRWLLVALVALVSAAAAPLVPADEPAPADKPAACAMLNQRILGPRSGGRPLPLLAGDPAHGFRAACSVPWSTLSPHNQALPILDCYQGSLLQVANDAACGRDTGPLWVSTRWVLTSADEQRPLNRAAACQHLETGALAATRDFQPDCLPQDKQTPPKAATAQHAPAQPAAPATPAAAAPNPSP
jgi:hypothetical protein